MKKNLNRLKILSLNKKNIYFSFLIILFLIIIFFSYKNKKLLINVFLDKIELFSIDFEYQYIYLDISGTIYVEPEYIESKLKKYEKSSIFLLPLNLISGEIKENNWIKNVKLTTNYKDTLFIEIEEFNPSGIYGFNDKLFYFDKNGKIIEQLNNQQSYNKNLIKFYGASSNLKAQLILDILKNLNFQNIYHVERIVFINKRRWDIYLENKMRLMLSENMPKKSLQNFISIEKTLSEADMNNITSIDLRNINKTLITYK